MRSSGVDLKQATNAVRAWAEAHRKASAAEERVLRAAVRFVRGDGPPPSAVQKEHALVLRREANQLRDGPADHAGRREQG
jgi:hypothetical protein